MFQPMAGRMLRRLQPSRLSLLSSVLIQIARQGLPEVSDQSVPAVFSLSWREVFGVRPFVGVRLLQVEQQATMYL